MWSVLERRHEACTSCEGTGNYICDLASVAHLPDPSRTLTHHGARQYALCRSSFQGLLQQPVGQTKQKSKCPLLPDFLLRINSRDTLRHVSVKLGNTECQCYQQL